MMQVDALPERLDLRAPEVCADPYPWYAALRRHAPVRQVAPGGMWAVARHDDVGHVLRRADLFSSAGFRPLLDPPWIERNPLIETLFLMDPPEHTRLRGLVAPAFHGRTIERMEPLIRGVVESCVDAMAARGAGEIYEDIARLIPAHVTTALLGLDPSLHPQMQRWARDLNTVSAAETDPAVIAGTRATIIELEAYLREVVAARRRAPRDDLATDLTRAEIEGVALSDREVVVFLMLLLVGGFETTAHLIACAAALLAERPELHAQLRGDPTQLPALIDEVLRYAPPTQALARVTTRPVELGGVPLPQGAILLLLLASANRDERYFHDPERFDIARERRPLLSFGHGAHFCLGSVLARLETRLALAALLSRFRGLELRAPVVWASTLFIRHPREVSLTYRIDP